MNLNYVRTRSGGSQVNRNPHKSNQPDMYLRHRTSQVAISLASSPLLYRMPASPSQRRSKPKSRTFTPHLLIGRNQVSQRSRSLVTDEAPRQHPTARRKRRMRSHRNERAQAGPRRIRGPVEHSARGRLMLQARLRLHHVRKNVRRYAACWAGAFPQARMTVGSWYWPHCASLFACAPLDRASLGIRRPPRP